MLCTVPMTSRFNGPWIFVVLAIGVASPAPARAALGDDAASVGVDSETLGGTRIVTLARGWEVHELRLPSGTLVREYVRNRGVFAVAWGGPVIPDLRRLLGAYFEAYANSPRSGQHHVRVVATPDWVVQSAGHHDGFLGRAWLPKRVPPGFDLHTVRVW